MKEQFESRRLKGSISLKLTNGEKWTKDKAELCGQIRMIINNYRDQGYTLTLRQLYYQLVAGDMIRNDDKVYKKLSSVLDDLRYSGLVDWSAIEDRGRVPYMPYVTNGVADAMRDIIYNYRRRRCDDQDNVIEVWTEKDAISGILKRITQKYTVHLVVNKGYSSSTAMYGAYNRIVEALQDGKNFHLYYFGDHDPSGLDMIRDIRERLVFMLKNGDHSEYFEEIYDYWHRDYWADFGYDELLEAGFITEEFFDNYSSDKEADVDKIRLATLCYALEQLGRFKVTPLGLTMDQIRQYRPPNNPAKITDPRAKWYIEQHGAVSWEVDALRPDVMERIVENGILSSIDLEKYNAILEEEETEKNRMKEFAKTFE